MNYLVKVIIAVLAFAKYVLNETKVAQLLHVKDQKVQKLFSKLIRITVFLPFSFSDQSFFFNLIYR